MKQMRAKLGATRKETGDTASSSKPSPPSVPSKASKPAIPSKAKKPAPKAPTAAGGGSGGANPSVPTKPQKKTARTITSDNDDEKKSAAALASAAAAKKKPAPPQPGAKKEKAAPPRSGAASASAGGGARKMSAAAAKSKPAPTPTPMAKRAAADMDEGALRKAYLNMQEEIDRLKARERELMQEVADAKLAEETAKSVQIGDSRTDTITRIIAQVKAAKALGARFQEMKPLLDILIEVQQFERHAPSVEKGVEHDAKLAEILEQYATLKGWGENWKPADSSRADVVQMRDSMLSTLNDTIKELHEVEELEKGDEEKLDSLLGRMRDVVRNIGATSGSLTTTPEKSLSVIVDEFLEWKKTFDSKNSDLERVAAKIHALAEEKDTMKSLNSVVEEKSKREKVLFDNTHWFISTKSRHEVDAEKLKKRAFYRAMQRELVVAHAHQKELETIEAQREKLVDDLKAAKKAHRSCKRELEDREDDGDLSEAEARKLRTAVKEAKAKLSAIERREEQLKLKAHSLLDGTSVDTAVATDRTLSGDYDYEPLREGYLKARLKGADSHSLLKIYQRPATDEELEKQLTKMRNLHHATLDRVMAAFTEGPHLYVNVSQPDYLTLGEWLHEAAPARAVIQSALRAVTTAVAFVHSHDMPHGRVCPEAVNVTEERGSFEVRLSDFWGPPPSKYAEAFFAPELASNFEHSLSLPSDMFSLGMLCVFAWTNGKTIERPSPASDVTVPSAVDNVNLSQACKAMLSSHPEHRPTAPKLLINNPFFFEARGGGAADDSESAGGGASRGTSPVDASFRERIAEARAALRQSVDSKTLKRLKDSYQSHNIEEVLASNDHFETRDGGAHIVPNGKQDDKMSFEAVGRYLLLKVLLGEPVSVPFAPLVHKYILGKLPASTRDLLHDLDLSEPSVGAELRALRLTNDAADLKLYFENVNDDGVVMGKGDRVTNATLDKYLRERAAAVLVKERESQLAALRSGFLWRTGPSQIEPAVRSVLKRLTPSDMAVLLAGESFVDGDLVVRHFEFEGEAASIGADAFKECLRALHPDDLRRFLYIVTGGASLTLSDEKCVATVFIGPKIKEFSVLPIMRHIYVASSFDYQILSGAINRLLKEADIPRA